MNIAHPYMLDTNAASTLIRGHITPEMQNLLMEHSICISVITEAELRFGVKRRPDATRLAKAVEIFLQDTPVLPWLSSTAQTYAELRTQMETQGIGLSAMDMLDRQPSDGRKLHAGQHRPLLYAGAWPAPARLVNLFPKII